MNNGDKKTLEDLLWDLCSIQDDITHLLEVGEYVRREKREREAIMEKIKAFVEAGWKR